MDCVALTVWENRISPVFDVAHDLMIVRIDNGKVADKRYVSFDPDRLSTLIATLEDQKVECLICGAISEMPARMIVDSGIHLIPFISGNLNQVLGYFAKGEPIVPFFLMPGCGCPRRATCGEHHRRRTNRPIKEEED
ncbi:MAG: NifB/NifX family molybdenum-iron cluster-binding protein [Desulfobacteraceae bacterium]|jgi:predicted Fe-Mo cluster-binding NifX family protein